MAVNEPSPKAKIIITIKICPSSTAVDTILSEVACV
jgi:hypothetical protein